MHDVYFSLTILTALNMKDGMTMTNIYGKETPFSRGTAVTILVIGWVCYFLAWGFNIIYYIIHPSEVKVKALSSKMYFFICGRKQHCCCHPDFGKSQELGNQPEEVRIDSQELKEIVKNQ